MQLINLIVDEKYGKSNINIIRGCVNLAKKLILFTVIFITSIFCFASPLFAFTAKTGENLNIAENIDDDVYAFSNNVVLSGSINGDLITAGSQVNINGNVSGDLFAAGGTITIDGNVDDSSRIAGGMISINSNLKNDLIAIGGQIDLSRDSVINGDVAINGGRIIVNGVIKGKTEISGGDITINGKIENDVKIFSSNIKIGDEAQITGNLNYESDKEAVISPNAKISGKTNWTKTEKKTGHEVTPEEKKGAVALFSATWIGGKIIKFIGFFILGILLILALPRTFNKFNERMKKSLGYCAGGGAIALFGTPFAIFILFLIGILLFVTIIGSVTGALVFITGVILCLIYAALLFVGNIYLSLFLGNLILCKATKNPNKYGWKVLAYFVGLAITSIIYAIPFIGWIVSFAGLLFGLGGLVMILKDWLFSCRKAKPVY